MSDRLGFLVVRGLSLDDVAAGLLRAAELAPGGARQERFVLSDEGDWAAALVLDRWDYVHQWAQALSKVSRAAAVSMLVIEGTWNYAVFNDGEHLLSMEFFPNECPSLFGHVERASLVLKCDTDVFVRYFNAVLAACLSDEEDEPSPVRAYDDDDFEAADEYGYMDFARRVNIPGDPVFVQPPIEVTAVGAGSSEWVGLSPWDRSLAV